MFEHEIAINEFQIDQFQKTVCDIPDETLFQPGLGHGHPPIWIMGHLTIAGESGLRMLGGTITHRDWLRLFGPGSSDQVAFDAALTKSVMVESVLSAYQSLRQLASGANSEAMSQPHRAQIFNDSPIKTAGQVISVLLTNHFGFHLAQLSSCRRVAGQSALF